MKIDSISLVLLFYNEEDTIESVFKEAYDFLEDSFNEFEIIVVAEGDDSTPSIAEKISKEYDEVKCISRKEKRGYGQALKTGLKAAEKEYTAYMDGDGQFRLRDLKKMTDHVNTAPIVIGNRKNREDPYLRKLIGSIFRNIASFSLPINYKDPKCGFKLFKTSILQEIKLNRTHAVDTELLTKVNHSGHNVKEVDLNHYSRENGDSKLGGFLGVPLLTIFGYLRDVLLIRREIS